MPLSKNFIDFLNEIKTYSDQDHFGHVWFRGQARSEYVLHSRLFRPLSSGSTLNQVILAEKNIYNNFRRSSVPYLGNTTGFELLFHMQHHGAPTRLLDWTLSLGVAIYFATEGWRNGEESSPHIWILSPHLLNSSLTGNHELFFPKNDVFDQYMAGQYELRHSLAVAPPLVNSRISAQNGCFTLQGDIRIPLDEELSMNGRKPDDILKRVEIPSDISDEVRWLCERVAGASRHSLFPDLDGLSVDMQQTLRVFTADSRGPSP